MNLDGNLPSYETQQKIKTSVNSVHTVVDGIDTKIDAMDAKVGTLLNGRVVKSIQRGLFSISFQNLVSVQISQVDPSKCFVILNSQYADVGLLLNSLTATKIEIWPAGRENQGGNQGSWQLIEYY